MDEGLVKIEEDGLVLGILFRQLYFFTGMSYLYAFAEPQHLDLLIEMLPE